MNKNKLLKTSIIILFFIILFGINCKCFAAEPLNLPFLLDTTNSQNEDANKVWEEKGNEIRQTYENIEKDVNNKLFSDSNKVGIIFAIIIVAVIALIIIGLVLNSVVGKRKYKKYLEQYNDEASKENDRIDISSTGKFEDDEEEPSDKKENEQNENENNQANNQIENQTENKENIENINNNINNNNTNNINNEENKQ